MLLSRSSHHRFNLVGIIVLVLGYLYLPADRDLALAQVPNGEPVVIKGAVQSEPVQPSRFDGDLRKLPKPRAWQPGEKIREIPRHLTRPESVPPRPAIPKRDPLLEIQEGVTPTRSDMRFSTPNLNFEGISFSGALPPDTVGAVGPDHYIQMVNDAGGSLVQIFDKSGNTLAGPLSLHSLWTAGGACASGLGDPIVLYDRLADRWLMSEFAETGNHLCVYISQTSDPVSDGWFLYDFTTPDFPDYPKYGVWPDAYYVSTNESSPAVYALDRQRMLAGQTATSQRFTASSLAGFSFQALIPGNLDGATEPPAGTPNFSMRHRDDEAHNPGLDDPNQDFLEIWEFHVDWNNSANSTFSGPTNIGIAEFDSELCGFVSFECFPQPGTATRLDPLREVVMHRLQYRNFGSRESLVGNFVTDVDGTDHGGIRWFELRRTGGGSWSLHQEGTYAPDAHHRWMGSIAMDQAGNIALGYSVSSNTVFPSIRYAGRLASDVSGTLPRGENTLVAGGASQTAATRWGDYSAMTVDPSDDCTFWYTNEYILAGTGGEWRTRIGTFSFSSCLSSEDFTLTVTKDGTGSGTVTSSTSGIDCGSDCSESYSSDTLVTLAATAAAGSTFGRWSGGGCSGTGTCTVAMETDKTVMATFVTPLAVASPLDDGEVNISYDEVMISGGLPPYTVTLRGTLPAGLSLDSSDGTLSGTPTQSGIKSVTVTVTDELGTTLKEKSRVKIFKAVSINTASLKEGTVGKNYSKTLKAKGGKKPYTWSLVSGSLPAGLALDGSTGKIIGVPTAAGNYNLTFQVADSLGGTDQQPLTVTVN